jgi:hypothetical protein
LREENIQTSEEISIRSLISDYEDLDNEIQVRLIDSIAKLAERHTNTTYNN